QDWILDFSNAEGTPASQPWMVSEAPKAVAPNTTPPKKVPGLRPSLVGGVPKPRPGVAFSVGERDEPVKGTTPAPGEAVPDPGPLPGENRAAGVSSPSLSPSAGFPSPSRAGGVSPLSLPVTQGALPEENRAAGVGPLSVSAAPQTQSGESRAGGVALPSL